MVLQTLMRRLLTLLGRIIRKFIIRLTITGRENLPSHGPLIIISNHFSWFEAPLIMLYLPYQTRYLVARELQNNFLFRLITQPFALIPVVRGQVDRAALRLALEVLAQSGVLGIMPEGGIDPDLRQQTVAGEVGQLEQHATSRTTGQLLTARPGAAFLAAQSQAPILPVAFWGTEKVAANVRRGRRTAVTMHIGPVFGPLTLLPGLQGTAKRQQLDALGDEMMHHLAALLPSENRGPYGP